MLIDKPLRDASWIWCHEDIDRVNQYALFRRRFSLPAVLGTAKLHIFADSRYWLWCNGRRVGFGPARYHRTEPWYDTHELSAYLHAGENVIALIVHSIGPVYACSSFIPRRGILLAALEWSGGGLVTDSSWRAVQETAYRADTPRVSNHQSFVEWFDAREAKLGWQEPDYDDNAWPAAAVIAPERIDMWESLKPRPIPHLTLIPKTPGRLLDTGIAVPDPAGDTDDLKSFAGLMEQSARLPGTGVEPDPVSLFPVAFQAPADCRQAAYAVFDFAENTNGYPVLEIEGDAGVQIDLGYGEHMDEGQVNCNTQGVRYISRLTMGGTRLRWQLLFPRTLRYLLVEVRGGRAVLHSLRLDVSTFPVSWQGRFVCPEAPELVRAWQIAAHTLQISMDDVYMDTPRRERAGWLGDMLPEALGSYYAFGETRLVRHSLHLFMRSQHEDGWISGRYPCQIRNNMPSYTASYTPQLLDYVMHSGDLEFARGLWPNIRRITAWFERQRTEDDLLIVYPTKKDITGKDLFPGYLLIDWAPTRLEGAVTGMVMYYYNYLRCAAVLAGMIGENAEAALLESLASRTKKAIQALLFDEKCGHYVNCRDETGLSRQAGCQENLLALLWDIASPEQVESIVRQLLPDDQPLPLWQAGGSRDWVKMGRGEVPYEGEGFVPIGSPFFAFFAYSAMFEIGRGPAALNSIKAHYGGLLARGETTVWEDWTGEASRSHGWSAGPAWMTGRYVLGVEPMSPAFRSVRICPSFCGLRRASGRVPTPHGCISVEWLREDDGDLLRLFIPDGIESVQAGFPAAAATAAALQLNGRPVQAVEQHLRRGPYQTCMLGPGRHELRL